MFTSFDWPYAVLYLILLLLAFLYKKSQQRVWVTIAIGVFFVFVAFRAPVVGADTFRYIRYLTGETSLNNIIGSDNRGDIELFFLIYGDIIRFITSSRFIVMVINSVIAFSPVIFLYKKYSYNPPFSFLAFFFLNCTNVYFIGLRQILGFSFILWALLYYSTHKEKNQKNGSDSNLKIKQNIKCWFLLMLSFLIGVLFHSSIIIYGIFIIIWLIVPLKSRLVASSLIVVSFVFGIVLQKLDVSSIFNLAYIYLSDLTDSSRLADYLLSTEEYEINGTFSLFKLSFFGLTSVLFMEKDKLNHIFTKLFITGIILYNLFLTVPILDRINSIFYMFGGVVFTWILTNRTNINKIQYIVKKSMSTIIILYFTLYAFVSLGRWDPGSDAKMHPYYFIFQDYPNHE